MHSVNCKLWERGKGHAQCIELQAVWMGYALTRMRTRGQNKVYHERCFTTQSYGEPDEGSWSVYVMKRASTYASKRAWSSPNYQSFCPLWEGTLYSPALNLMQKGARKVSLAGNRGNPQNLLDVIRFFGLHSCTQFRVEEKGNWIRAKTGCSAAPRHTSSSRSGISNSQ